MSGEEPTQPFSDPAEVQRRLDKTKAEAREAEASLMGLLDAESVVAGPQNNRQVTSLTNAFSDASLASLRDARLVLACHDRWQIHDSPHSPVLRLPPSTDGWDVIGVVQRTQDVDFAIHIPVYDLNHGEPSPRAIPFRLKCNIYYNPASDSCLLINMSIKGIFLAGLSPTASRDHLASDQTRVVGPGIWRISLGGDNGKPQQQVVDFMILRRQFAVTVHETLEGPARSAKRPISNAEDGATKRRRLGPDVTEVLLSVPTSPFGGSSASAQRLATVPASITTPFRQIARVSGTLLLELLDGEVAVVRTTSKAPGDASATDQMATYRLDRLEHIADTLAASVFTCRHSSLVDSVVAKVVRYKDTSANSLINCATSWRREKHYLEKLHHPNIISLKAFDGRLFAIYVELLPSSLSRGPNSPFRPAEARTVLRDVSSALVYLAEKEVAHNDIKPANIAYSPQRGAVLLDFGLATSTTDGLRYGGTPWYIPPDIIERKTRGAPGDVWALAITMLYVLGKTKLPEKMVRGWMIRDVKDPNSDARRRMTAWINLIIATKEKLDQSEAVEVLVYQMLELGGNLRIKAAQIVAAFDHIPHASVNFIDGFEDDSAAVL